MKTFLIQAACCLLLHGAVAQTSGKLADTSLMQPVEVIAIRASDKNPVAKTNLSKKEIEKKNIGQDLPFILNQVPNVQVNSDAGNGIGYTGIRIRGSDASRINLTINGIPYNDAESQGIFFVNVPDLAASASGIQVQRGVGTSTNGAGAFGGSVNINTNDIEEKRYLQFNNNFGSFNSFRNTLQLNSGLVNKHFVVTGRVSSVRSDGYVERADSRLQSYFSSAAYVDNDKSIRLNIFSGKEKTYQAWYGVSEAMLAANRRFNSAGTEKPGIPYENETDNYKQTHYQFFYNQRLSKSWKMSVAFFLTKGKGYYEQYKAAQSLQDYGLPDYISGQDTITETDLVRRLWLDNYFYGATYSFQYQQKKSQVIIGGAANQYDGKHYGEIINAIEKGAVPANYKWYDLIASKKDISLFGKWTYQLNTHWQTYVDVQGRSVNYSINGFRNNPGIELRNEYFFFNPKAGITYNHKNVQYYFSYARAAKEPNRDDFEAGLNQQPRPEKLNDLEAGIEIKKKNLSWSINLYYMWYKDQLVLTGKVNDVGAYTRTNIDRSYRAGIELQAAVTVSKWLQISGNVAFSQNKVRNFTEYIDDYDNGGQQTKSYSKTDISFSPAVVGAASIVITPFKNTEISFPMKYVGKQFLDNTSASNRQLSAYFVQDLRLGYTWSYGKNKSLQFHVQGMNIFSSAYEPNGYSFSYISGGTQTTENYYYPMAPFYVMAGIGVKL